MVTLLIEEDRRDKANGLVGSTLGVSILVTSVISGLLVAAGDMFYVLLLAMAVLLLAVAHLARVTVDEERPPDPAVEVDPAAEPAPRSPGARTRSTSEAPCGWSAASPACWR